MSGETGFFQTIVDLENMLPRLPDNSFGAGEGSLNVEFNLFPLLEQINENIDDIFIGQIILIEQNIIPKYKELLQDPEKTAKEKQVIKSQIRMLMSMQLDPCFKHLENLLLFEDFFNNGENSYFKNNIFRRLRFLNNNQVFLPYIQFEDSLFPDLFVQQDSEQLKTSLKDMFKRYKYTSILLIDNNTIIELFPDEFTQPELDDINHYIEQDGFPEGKILLMKTIFFDLLNDNFSFRKMLALIVLVTRLNFSDINYSSVFGKLNIYKEFVNILTNKETRELMEEMNEFRAETTLKKNVQRDMTADNTAKARNKGILETSGIEEGRVVPRRHAIGRILDPNLLPSIDSFKDVYITSDEILGSLESFFRFDINDIDVLKDCVNFLLKIIDGTFMKMIFEGENLNEKYNYDIERIRTRTMKYLNIDDDTIRSLQIFNKLCNDAIPEENVNFQGNMDSGVMDDYISRPLPSGSQASFGSDAGFDFDFGSEVGSDDSSVTVQRGGARPQGPIIYELPSFYILNAMDENEYDIMMKNVYDNERVCKIIQEKYIDDNIGDNTFIKPYFKQENRDVNELMTYLNDIGPKIIEEKELDWRRNFQTGGKKSRSKRSKTNKRGTKKQKRNKKNTN